MNKLLANIIKLKLIPGIGDRTIQLISSKCDIGNQELSYEMIAKSLNNKQKEIFQEFYPKLDQELDKVMLSIIKNNIKVASLSSSDYPEALKNIYNPPAILFYKGNLEYNFSKSIAIVGTRDFTEYGESQCRSFTKYFVENGFSIISGLAYGIDSIAHREALKYSNSKCIGVVGHGLEHVYPSRNKRLFDEIVDKGGAIVSQFLPGMEPKSEYFPLRNRVIAALSKGILVVEAADKSGSLITANNAFDMDRSVYAIPADLSRIKSEGCNILIKNQIAKLVTSPEDIILDFGLNIDKTNQISDVKSNKVVNEKYKPVLKLLAFKPLTSDMIANKLGTNIQQISSILSEMELDGCVTKNTLMEWYLI